MDQAKGRKIFFKYIRKYFDDTLSTSSCIGQEFKKELEKFDIKIDYCSSSVKRFLFWYRSHVYTIYKGNMEVYKFAIWNNCDLKPTTLLACDNNSQTYNLVEGDWLIEIENAYLKVHNCELINDTFEKKAESIAKTIQKLEGDCDHLIQEEYKEKNEVAIAYIQKLKESGFTYKVETIYSGSSYEFDLGYDKPCSTCSVRSDYYIYKDNELVLWENSYKNDLGRSYNTRYYKDCKWVEEFENIMNSSPYYQVEENSPTEMKLKPENNANN